MELFAAYGLKISIPEDWRIEFNSKSNRERGDVAFHSPLENVFFISWGRLEEAQKRYVSLEAQRNESVKRVSKIPNVQKAEVVSSSKQLVYGHEGLLTRILVQPRKNFLGKEEPSQEVWSIHFYCPEARRYVVVYWHIKRRDEFSDPERDFMSILRTVACH